MSGLSACQHGSASRLARRLVTQDTSLPIISMNREGRAGSPLPAALPTLPESEPYKAGAQRSARPTPCTGSGSPYVSQFLKILLPMKVRPYTPPLPRLGLVVAWVLLASAGGSSHADIAYPGPLPGPAIASSDVSGISLGNRVLSARWTLDARGLRPLSFADLPGARTVTFTGEVFRVILTNGVGYPASSFQPDGQARVTRIDPTPNSARLAGHFPATSVELSLHSADNRLRATWKALLHDGANYLRQELLLEATGTECPLQEIVWLEASIPGARTMGDVDGSPMVAGGFFMGAEDPHSANRASPEGVTRCRQPRRATLRPGETFTSSFVTGVTPPGQLRRGFLYYLERERAHPYRPYLHYNSWYDTAWAPFALNESNCIDAIRQFGEKLIRQHDVVLDGLVFDDGWDNPKSLWQFHSGFPKGFTPLSALCRDYHTRLGVWLSPFGGYGEPKDQRLRYGREQGYETNATGFSLAGPKYYAAFRDSCLRMIREYGVNHFKFDGIANGMYANGASDYVRDTEAMRRLMLELRGAEPELYINLTTGSWPSPFWLRYADSLWRQGGDMGLAGKGTQQQQWLTYRDQETYRNIVQKGPLYPLNSLMTQGVAYSRQGSAGEPSFNSAGFKDDVRAFFGSGTSLQELYIQPGKLTAEDWRVLAEAAKWSRAHADVLVDTHWIGGDPSKLEVGGFASWSPRMGIVSLRNPDDRTHEFALDVGTAFELPPGAPTRYSLRAPWRDAPQPPATVAEAGKPVIIRMSPFEIVVLEAIP